MTHSGGIAPPNAPGARLSNMLIISLVIHVLILTGGAFMRVTSTPRMTFGPVYSVQLVNLPSTGITQTSSTSALNQEIIKAEPKDRSKVIRKTVEDRIAPIKRIESTTDRRSQIDKAIERLRKKAADESAAANSAASSTSSGGQQAAATDARFNEYVRTVWSRIKSQWAFPGNIVPKGGLEAIIQVRIMRNGALSIIGWEKRSGNRYFDDSVMRAITKANPLPAIPAWFGENSLEVVIRFHSSDLK